MPRLPQHPAAVPARVVGKLRVKDRVLGGHKERIVGICISEMQQLFMCFKKFAFNQEACAQELKNFNTCYNSHLTQYKTKKLNSENTPHKEITKLLRKYPERSGHLYK